METTIHPVLLTRSGENQPTLQDTTFPVPMILDPCSESGTNQQKPSHESADLDAKRSGQQVENSSTLIDTVDVSKLLP